MTWMAVTLFDFSSTGFGRAGRVENCWCGCPWMIGPGRRMSGCYRLVLLIGAVCSPAPLSMASCSALPGEFAFEYCKFFFSRDRCFPAKSEPAQQLCFIEVIWCNSELLSSLQLTSCLISSCRSVLSCCCCLCGESCLRWWRRVLLHLIPYKLHSFL